MNRLKEYASKLFFYYILNIPATFKNYSLAKSELLGRALFTLDSDFLSDYKPNFNLKTT